MRQVKEIAADITPGRDWPGEPATVRRTIERATLDQLEITHPNLERAIHRAKAWSLRKAAGQQDASLVLSGNPGTGKTHIAWAILWSICYQLDDGRPVAPVGRFWLADDLIQAIEPPRQVGEDVTPGARLGLLISSNAPLVVVDDVGTESTLPYVKGEHQAHEVRQRYFRLVNYCYEWGISLIITTNLPLPRLEGVIGGRAWSRLMEMASAGFMVELSGVPDYRKVRSGR